MSSDTRSPIITDEMLRIATEEESPTNYVYQAPAGIQRLIVPKNGIIYKVRPPSAQTDRLQEFERRYVIPIAMATAPSFGVLPITDDIFRQLPEYHRKRNLYCIISRSRIEKTGRGVEWECVVVVVKEFCVARVATLLDPVGDKFKIEKIHLWSKTTQNYEVVEDTEAKFVNPEMVPYVMDRYAKIENIA